MKFTGASGTQPVGGPMSFKNGYLAIALMSGLSVVACSNTAAGVEKDADVNADKAATAADRAEDRVDPAIDQAQGAAREAGSATAAAIETVDVKSALMADRSVDASHINVDTFHETKTVVL